MRFVVFLDIDGVLNTRTTVKRTPYGYTGIDDANWKLAGEEGEVLYKMHLEQKCSEWESSYLFFKIKKRCEHIIRTYKREEQSLIC